MKIALASAPVPVSLHDALMQVKEFSGAASEQGATIICFPETYLPGYPFEEFNIQPATKEQLQAALEEACYIATSQSIAIILPMDWYEGDQFLNAAFVISAKGEVLGYQAKVQLDPTEDNTWIPGTQRKLFEINGMKFGISICHEGFRYPETIRWAARNGAQIVFHPHCAGSNVSGPVLKEWGHKDNPYYEKAMMMRSIENGIYFASVNYALRYQESATTVITPDGSYLAHQPYGEKGILIANIDPALATGNLAKRYREIH
jgi:predicted amidohydrolase